MYWYNSVPKNCKLLFNESNQSRSKFFAKLWKRWFSKDFWQKNVLLCKTKICRNSFFCERKLFSWAGEDFSWTWKWCASMVGLKQLWKKREFVVMNWKRSSWDRESWWDRKEKVFLRKSERGVQQEIQRDWLCHAERERLLRKVKKEIQRDR